MLESSSSIGNIRCTVVIASGIGIYPFSVSPFVIVWIVADADPLVIISAA